MVDIVLTEEQKIAASTQTLDLVLKSAVAGAVLYVVWHALVKKSRIGGDLPTRMARRKSSWAGNRFGGS